MIAGFFRRPLYVQLSAEWLSVRDPARGITVAGPAEIALRNEGKKTIVVAYGQSARDALLVEPDLSLRRPFAHPRSLLSDFVLAEVLLKAFIYELRDGAWLKLAQQIILHPLGEFDGGLTQIECRALRDLALGAGASDVILWQGRKLSDAEALDDGLRAEAARLNLPG